MRIEILITFDVFLFSGETKIICPVCKTESNTSAIRPNHEKVLLVDNYKQQQQHLPTFDSTSASESYFENCIKLKKKIMYLSTPAVSWVLN